jgi:hypothetical protein
MFKSGCAAVLLVAMAAGPARAQDRDPLARARTLYNQGRFNSALSAAEQARLNPARADSADLIAARAYLELYRESAAPTDLTSARDRLRRLDPQRLADHERVEYMIGLGETLFFDTSFGAAAVVFDSVLLRTDLLTVAERERVLDWWATALDRDARPRTEIERQGVYQRVQERMQEELGRAPTSSAALYWLSVAARGQGDLQSAWEAAQAGWVRAPLTSDHGVSLRADLDTLVLQALVPERARALGQPPDVIRSEWERFKERWAKE